jgi:hypothetical protein
MQQIAFGQSACSTYDGDYNKILSVLKNKNTLTGYDKYLDSELEKIAKYWVAVCKCEKGVKTREEANEIFMEIPASVPVAQYMYHGKMVKRKVAHFGDLIPTQKTYTASSCMSGSSEPADMKSSMDCTPEAANFYRTASDKQQYGKAYFRAYCECKNGVISTDRAKELIAEMKINHQNYHQYKAPSDPTLSKPITDYTLCAISSRGQTNSTTKDKFSIYEDPLINSEVQGFIHELAANSNNPDLITLSKELQGFNDVQADVDNYREFFNITPTQEDLEFDRTMTNLAQGISVAKFIVNSFKEKEIVLSPSQEAARKSMRKVLINIKQLQLVQGKMPYLKDKRVDLISTLDNYEKSIYVYDLATAKQRLLLIKFYWNSRDLDIEELKNLSNQVYSLTNMQAVRQIEELQKTTNFKNAFYLANSSQSFKITFYLIQLQKIRFLKEAGRIEEALALEQNLSLDITTGEAIKLMQDAFYNGDYELTAKFYPLAKEYFQYNTLSNSVSKTSFFISMGAGQKDLVLSEDFILMLLSSGIYSKVMNDNSASVQEDLDFINEFKQLNKIEGEGVVEGINTLILMQNNQNEKALLEINKGISMLTENTGVYNWLYFLKFKALVSLNRFEEAHTEYNLINQNYKLQSFSKNTGYGVFNKPEAFFNIYELKYEKCMLLVKEKDYEAALYGLELLQGVNPQPKYQILKDYILLTQQQE